MKEHGVKKELKVVASHKIKVGELDCSRTLPYDTRLALACQASQIISKHGTGYYKQLLEQYKQ
ncbi:hypothetical protein MTR_7g083010 [Medicago truncatula]|uniref:Uncharacterized protein n=1 Tax=Medicago truncatula TaxID=3880 RepID=G7KW39_MEDTR|nr:hypothetical protein MTR_7g083010 [Medicago truncatula]